MPLDAGMIAALAQELREKLTGAKIEKIHQPERDKAELYFRAGGETLRLAAYASPGSARAHLTELPKEHPATPPMFCTLLRKHLASGILRQIEQPGFERMLTFRFTARDEMGFETKRALVLEMMGKYTNMLLLGEDDRIISVLRPIDFSSGEPRQLLAGLRYELPPSQEGKEDPLCETKEGFIQKAQAAAERPADRFLSGAYRGFSPLIAREIAFLACGATDAPAGGNAEALYERFAEVTGRIKEGGFEPCILHFDGEAKDEYTFMPIRQYGSAAALERFESASRMLDRFYEEKERSEAVRRQAQDLFRLLGSAEARLERKIAAQKKELAACSDKEKYKQYGELITANLYKLSKGEKSAMLTDYYDPALPEVTLELDIRLTPAQNAQRYFKKYTKAKTAEKELAAQIEKAEAELAYVRSVADALERSSLPSDAEEVRAELIRTGYLKLKRGQSVRKRPAAGYLTYESSDGYRILCGRNNLQNDELSAKIAGKNDWWFHVHNAPGGHVILLCDGDDDPPARTFTEAAAVAAHNSSLRGEARATVDYTRVKNLKKPPAARPGYFIYHTNYSAEVDPGIEKDLKKR